MPVFLPSSVARVSALERHGDVTSNVSARSLSQQSSCRKGRVMIEVTNLTKEYRDLRRGHVRAVDGVSDVHG